MNYNGMVVLVAIAVSTAGCDRQIQPRPEVNRPAPAMTIFEEPVTVGHEPEIIGPTEQLRYPRREAFASVDSQTAPIKSETPANNPVPAPLRPRSDVPPLPCSDEPFRTLVSSVDSFQGWDDSTLGQEIEGKSCIMEVILNKDLTIRGARMIDGRIFTYDPNRNRLIEQAVTQTETPADKPWYAWITNEQVERYVIPVFLAVLTIFALIGLVRFFWHRTAPTPSSHNHRGGLTEQEFRGLSRAEQIRLERAMVDIEIESARGAAQFAHQRRRSTLDLEQFLAREDRKLIEARVEADLLIIEAAGDAEIARLNALEAEYDAAKEETEGGFVDDDLFEDTPAATVPSAETIDDALEQSGFGEDDGIDPDGNV